MLKPSERLNRQMTLGTTGGQWFFYTGVSPNQTYRF